MSGLSKRSKKSRNIPQTERAKTSYEETAREKDVRKKILKIAVKKWSVRNMKGEATERKPKKVSKIKLHKQEVNTAKEHVRLNKGIARHIKELYNKYKLKKEANDVGSEECFSDGLSLETNEKQTKTNLLLNEKERNSKEDNKSEEVLINQTKELIKNLLEVSNNVEHSKHLKDIIKDLSNYLENMNNDNVDNKEESKVKVEEVFSTQSTYDKLKEVLQSDKESIKIQNTEKEIHKKYQDKIKLLEFMKKFNKMTQEDFNKNKTQIDKWYGNEMGILNANKNKVIADALKKTATLIEYPNKNVNKIKNKDLINIVDNYCSKDNMHKNIYERMPKDSSPVKIIDEGYVTNTINKECKIIVPHINLNKHINECTIPNIKRGIRTDIRNVKEYMERLFDEVLKDSELFIKSVSVPLSRDPLFILGQIQNEDKEYFACIEQVITEPILPIEIYLSLENARKIYPVDESYKDPEHSKLLIEWSNIHNKCIFDAINDALDIYRPYELDGPPLPWSNKVHALTYRFGLLEVVEDIVIGVKNKVLSWSNIKAGALRLKANNIEQEVKEIERNELKILRQEKIDLILDIDVRLRV